MDKKYVLSLLAVCVITHIIRSAYEILKHKKIVRPGRLSFIIIFANMALLWVSWFALCTVRVYTIHLPGMVRYLGLTLVGVGMLIFLIALLTIRTLETYSGGLITSGIYAKIRHPMYAGFILWSIGWPAFTQAALAWIPALVFIANIMFWRYLEELELAHRFSAYADYKKKTFF